MATNFLFSFLIGLGLIFLIDIYCFKALTLLVKKMSTFIRTLSFIVYWSISAIFLFGILTVLIFPPTTQDALGYGKFMIVLSFLYLFYLPKTVFVFFHLLDDITSLIVFVIKRLNNKNEHSRKLLLSKFGVLVALFVMGAVIYGMIWGKFNYQVKQVEVKSNRIPLAFDGYRIALFSDFHAGSMEQHKEKVKVGFELLASQKPDVIFFAGDMVNHFSDELKGWNSVFYILNAPDGKFAVLGNHDYGDYIEWPDSLQKEVDRQKLIAYQDSFGFKVLKNEHVTIKRGGDSIYVAGVENFGMPPFKRYGNLSKALDGIDTSKCVLLLSHEPKHWDEEIKQNQSVVLTVSGHTHAMQMGIDWHGILWSPAQYVFKRWYGLYSESGSYLYVNRGFGYLAFPGRVGMSPEITIITLKHN